MKTNQLIAAAAIFAAAGSASAQKIYPYVDFSGFQSTKSRAEVIQELRDSKTHSVASGNSEYTDPAAGFVSTMTRAQVRAELEQSRNDGSYAIAHQEYEGQFRGLGNGVGEHTRIARSEAASGVNSR